MTLDCLVIRQPYASLIVFGYKRWEFRRNDTKKRGLVGIVASPGEPLKTKNNVFNRYRSIFPRGLLLGTAELTSSFYVTSADLQDNLSEPVEVSLHKHTFTTLGEPLGEPVDDVTHAIGQRNWESHAWLFENIKPIKPFVPIQRLGRSTWVQMEVN